MVSSDCHNRCEARIGSQSGRSDVFLPQTWPFSEYTNPALSVIPSEQSQDLTDQEKLDVSEFVRPDIREFY